MKKPAKGTFGPLLFVFLAYYLVLTVGVAIVWNVGLYGAGLVNNKIGFWTAVGLALGVNILRSILRRPPTTINNYYSGKADG